MRKPKRITFILPDFGAGGGTRVVAEFTNHLRRLGHTVHCIAPIRTPTLRERLKEFVRPSPEWIQATDWFDSDVARRIELSRLRRGGGLPEADWIFGTWWETVEWIEALPARFGRQAQLVQGLEIFPYLPEERATAVLRKPIPKIAVSNWLKHEVERRFYNGNIIVIENATRSYKEFSSLRLKNSKPRIGFVYSDVPVKRMDIALDVCKAIVGLRDPEIISFGHYEPRRNLDGISFQRNPSLELKNCIYASCDVWLFTSDSEGFGLPILEAMACRTPVVATRAGAAPELVPGSGYLADHTVDDLVKGVTHFLDMPPDEWAARSEAAYRRATARSWTDAAREFIAALESFEQEGV